MELVDTHRRSATLLTERQELAVKTRSLQAALADAQARGLKADLIGAGLPRYVCVLEFPRLCSSYRVCARGIFVVGCVRDTWMSVDRVLESMPICR